MKIFALGILKNDRQILLRVLFALVFSVFVSSTGWAQASGNAGSSAAMGMVSSVASGAIGVFMVNLGRGEVTDGTAQVAKGNATIASCAEGGGCGGPAMVSAGNAQISQGHINEAMGAMALLNAASSLATSGQNSDSSGGLGSSGTPADCSGTDSGCAGMGATGAGPANAGLGAGFGALPPDQQAAAMAAYKDGYSANANGVSTPNGNIAGGSLASGAAMADAGLIGKDQIAAMDKNIKDALDRAHITTMGLAGGGGGGGASGSNNSKTEYVDDWGAGKRKLNIHGPQTAGLTRTLASGEAIGSQVDDIFQMITRKYQDKSKERIFVGQEPAPQK